MSKSIDSDKINIIKLAHLHYQAGEWDNTIEEYQKLLEMDPKDINVHKMLGDVYVKKNDFARAYEEYNKVVSYFISVGQMDKATQMHEKIARLDKKQLSPEAQQKQNLIQWRMMADEALAAEKLEEAVKALGEILKLNPEDTTATIKLAELEEKTGKIPQAVERYIRLGEWFLKSHQFKKAQELLKKAVALDPLNIAPQVSLAQIYVKQGQESDAKKEYLSIAEKALAQDNLDTALECAGKAVELKSIEAYYIVGVVLFKRRMWAASKVAFDHLLRIKVNHASAQVYLAKVYDAMGRPEKAVETFQKAIQNDKEGLLALEAWADYCVNQKDHPEAIKTLTILLEKAEAAGDSNRVSEFAQRMKAVNPGWVPPPSKLVPLEMRGEMVAEPDEKHPPVDSHPAEEESISSVFSKQGRTRERRLANRISVEDSSLSFSLKVDEPDEESLKGPGSTADSPARAEVTETAPARAKAPLDEVDLAESVQAQIGLADQYAQQGLLEEAFAIYQQLLEGHPNHEDVQRKLNHLYGVYAKTGMDLTKVFEVTSPLSEEEIKKNLKEAEGTLKEIEREALAQADRKIRIESGRKERAEARLGDLASAHKILKELEIIALGEASQKVKSELERQTRETVEKKTGVDMKRLELAKDKTLQSLLKSPLVLTKAQPLTAEPEKNLTGKKRSNKIGYV